MVNHLRGPFLVAQRSCSNSANKYQVLVQDAIRLWSNRNEPLVLLISSTYVYAASMAEMRRESREVLPAMVFTHSEI
jgi:hypothetical protein